jgi:hypothetical protein
MEVGSIYNNIVENACDDIWEYKKEYKIYVLYACVITSFPDFENGTGL